MQRGWLITTACVVTAQMTITAQVPELAPERAPSSGHVAAASEPGQRLIVAGRVRDAESQQPVANASLYIYQTDANGLYTPGPSNDNRNPRLRVHLRSDETGAFEAHTIRPAPYPQGRVPAHIHFVVTATGYARRVFEIVFDDDPLVTTQIRSRAADARSGYVIAAPPAAGQPRIEQDVLLFRE